MKGTKVLLASGLLGAALPGASQVPDPLDRIKSETIRAHMTFLADDLLEGRGTGTSGFELAAKYVAAQFAAVGLQPAGTEGGYYQRVRFRHTRPIPEQSSLALLYGATPHPLEWGRDFVARGNVFQSPATITAPILFVGYGLSAPEYGHDDYEGDVRGAIVAFLPGVPPNLPVDRRDYYTSVKWLLAQQRGAVATIELSTPEQDKTWTWEDRMSWVTHGAATWLEPDGGLPADQLLPRVLLSSAGTARLLSAVSRTITDVTAAPRSFRLPDAVLTVAAVHDDMTAPQVLGVHLAAIRRCVTNTWSMSRISMARDAASRSMGMTFATVRSITAWAPRSC